MRVHQQFAAVAAYASRHHGLVTTKAMHRFGVAPTTITSWVQRGRLERVAPEVYRINGSPKTWPQGVMLATMDSGGLASHRTAAALHRLDGHPGRIIEVTVPRWRRSSKRSTYVVHESKDLRPCDADDVAGIPCTSLVRTLIDLPAVEHPFRAEQALDDACRRVDGLITPVHHRFLQVARRGRNGTRAMRPLIAERVGTKVLAGSDFETKMLRLIQAAGIEEPTRQVHIVDGTDEFFLDLGWEPIRFGLECDSLAFHFSKRAQAWDRRRRRILKRLGWEIVEYIYDEVVKTPDAVAQELRQLLALRLSHVLASTAADIRSQ